MEKKSRQWVIDNFSVEVIGKKLEEIIDAMPSVEFDFDLKTSQFNAEYTPKQDYSTPQDFIIDIYKNILNDDVDERSQGVKHWVNLLSKGTPPHNVVNHFKQIATDQQNKLKTPDLSTMLGDEDKGKRIAVVIPRSETDVLLVNSLLKNLKKQYKKYNIYVFTEPQYFSCIDDNPYVYNILPYSTILESPLMMEGVGEHDGVFDITFYPHTTTQKNTSYIHNGLDKHQFSLR